MSKIKPPSIQTRGSTHLLRVKHKLLAAPFFRTFDDYDEALAFGINLKKYLNAGTIPAVVAAHVKAPEDKAADPLVIEVVRDYTKRAAVTESDDALLTVLLSEVAGMRLSMLTVQWVEQYVLLLKTDQNLAPGTIRKRIGSLGRVLDWHLNRTTPKGQPKPANPFRGLPIGYSHYSRDEAAMLGEGKKAKRDEARDRRLLPEEEATVRAILGGAKMPEKSKGVKKEPAFGLLFELILDTGLRLSEAYRLRVDQLELDKGYIRVEGSKGARGAIKPRTVPLKKNLIPLLRDRANEVGTGLLFPWWNGEIETKKATSAYLSKRFEQLFSYCGIIDFTEHDLRHEATCRWVTMRNARGWIFSEVEIAKIMGWSSLAMMLRYASLRGEDLAARMADF